MPVIKDTNNADSEIKIPRNTSNKMELLDNRLDDLYKDIYISRTDNRDAVTSVINKIDASIDRLQANNMTVSGMSELLRRQESKDGNKLSKTSQDLVNSVEDLFNDQSLLSNLFMNTDIHRYIAGQNYQYDMICKYLPKLLIALELKRDNVLFSDTFSKKFLNPKSVKTSEDEVTIFSANSKRLDNKYDLDEFLDETYMNTSIYGEDFIYIVPYREAFQRLLKRSNYRRNSARLGSVQFYETVSIKNTNRKMLDSDMVTCVAESFLTSAEYKSYLNSVKKSFPIEDLSNVKFEGCAVNLHFNNTNIALDKINEYTIVHDKSMLEKFMSIYEGNDTDSSFTEDSNISVPSKINMKTDASKLDSVFANMNRKSNSRNNIYSDGLVVPNDVDRDPDKLDHDFTGAVLERLPRENIIPVYIGEKQCLGYYYLDFRKDDTACGYCGGHHITPGIAGAANYAYEMTENQQELAIRYIASRISQSIDTHFINANKDLKEEIYAVLRYNEKFDLSRTNDICVSFIPAEDIVHCYFKLDKHTHRGISDLQKSVVPAMLYILLSLTDTIGKITRGVDRRIYYVKQNVEQNVAKTMMNVVQQIKKGNFGMRQIESMNNILNIVGKYNDFIIPLSQSGDAPIQFEVMQGQNIDTPIDLMNKMEDDAVNATGVPLEFVNSSLQQDFATRFTMSNTRFLKTVFTRQRKTKRFFSAIYTKLYNYEYRENYSYIEVELPPPLYLIATNMQQMFDLISQQADKLSDNLLYDKEDNVKQAFKAIHIKNSLGTYIDIDLITKEIEEAEAKVKTDEKPATEDGEDSGDEESGGGYGF